MNANDIEQLQIDYLIVRKALEQLVFAARHVWDKSPHLEQRIENAQTALAWTQDVECECEEQS